MADKVDLVASCYEKFLFGFSVDDGESKSLRKARTYSVFPAVLHAAFELLSESADANYVTQMMAVQAHMGAVKCVASGGGYIASGGADDLIRRARRDLTCSVATGDCPDAALRRLLDACKRDGPVN